MWVCAWMTSNPVLYHKTLVSIIKMFLCKLPLWSKPETLLCWQTVWLGRDFFSLERWCIVSVHCCAKFLSIHSCWKKAKTVFLEWKPQIHLITSCYTLLLDLLALCGAQKLVSLKASCCLPLVLLHVWKQFVLFACILILLRLFSLSLWCQWLPDWFHQKHGSLVICLNVTAFVYSFLMSNLLCEQCLSLLSSII